MRAEKVFVRIKFPSVRVLKENIGLWHLHAPKGRIVGYEDENGIKCNEDGSYKFDPTCNSLSCDQT
tara:strand:- start:7 stop:204 length:198 start_codon:yes stop_codon:yes gene_type:complete